MSVEVASAPTITDPVVEAVAVAQAEAAPAEEVPAVVSEEATATPAVEAAEATEATKEETKAEDTVAAEKAPTNKRASFSFNKLFKSHVSWPPPVNAPRPRRPGRAGPASGSAPTHTPKQGATPSQPIRSGDINLTTTKGGPHGSDPSRLIRLDRLG